MKFYNFSEMTFDAFPQSCVSCVSHNNQWTISHPIPKKQRSTTYWPKMVNFICCLPLFALLTACIQTCIACNSKQTCWYVLLLQISYFSQLLFQTSLFPFSFINDQYALIFCLVFSVLLMTSSFERILAQFYFINHAVLPQYVEQSFAYSQPSRLNFFQ